MGQKDLREKLLEDYEDVFSDIFNGLLFKENVIEKQYLKSDKVESVYKAEMGNYRDQFRYVIKEYRNRCMLEIGFLGIENQSKYDEYSCAAKPPVQCGESHLSRLTGATNSLFY